MNSTKYVTAKLEYNHADVRRVMNELKQKDFLQILDPVETFGNQEGWQCKPFCTLSHDSHHEYMYEPGPNVWYTNKNKAIAAAYIDVLKHFQLTYFLPETRTQSCEECTNCENLKRRIDELENQLGWR